MVEGTAIDHPLTPEERRALVEKPLPCIRTYGSEYLHAGISSQQDKPGAGANDYEMTYPHVVNG